MEQESAHMIGVGYLKGWKEAGVDIMLGIVSQLDNASKVLHGYTSGIPEPGDTNIKDEVLAIVIIDINVLDDYLKIKFNNAVLITTYHYSVGQSIDEAHRVCIAWFSAYSCSISGVLNYIPCT